MEDQTKSTSAEGEEQPQTQEVKEPELEEGAAAEPAEGAEEEKVKEEEASPRTYSEEEWNKRQSSWDTQTSELKKSHQTEIATINQQYGQLIAQERARQNAEFLKKVEDEGGNVDAAKAIIAREEALMAREQEDARKAQEFEEARRLVAEEAKAIAAHRMAAQYRVDEKELLKAESRVEMENIALKLHAEKLKAGQKRPIKTDSGTSSAKGIDLSKMTEIERVKWALEHEE